MVRSRLAGMSLAGACWVGCATFSVTPATRDDPPKGIRVYQSRVCLFVDVGEKKSALAYLPDYSRAYDIKPWTIVAKQDFKIELEEAQLETLTSNQDTTAFLSFLKEAGSLAAKAVGAGVSAQVLNGSFGFDESGIYCMDEKGHFGR